MPLLRLDDVDAGYHRAEPVLRGVSVSVEPGEVCVVLGPNGAGKSTLVRVVMGLLPVLRGQAEVAGQRLPQPPAVLARKVAWVPQRAEAGGDFTALELALLGASPRLGAWGLPSSADAALARSLLDELGVGHLASTPLDEVSGGERRRVWLARALVQRPQLLVLDEPTAFLDVRHQLETLLLIRRRAEQGLGVLAVLHDVNLAARVATKVVLLKGGRTLAAGPVSEVLSAARLSELYDVPMASARPGDAVFSPQWPEVTR